MVKMFSYRFHADREPQHPCAVIHRAHIFDISAR
jgi:hypothetical protein